MQSDAGNSPAQFPTTHWSEVARAGAADPRVRREALGRLLAAYLPAFRAHLVGRKRIPADRAEDLLQGFVCDRVVAEDLVARADRDRGRFRGYVVAALDRYVAAVRRSENALKRKPDKPLVSIGDDEPGAGGQGAADAFDRAWAREVVQRSVREMRDRCAGGRRRVWDAFEACVLAPLLEGAAAPTHAVLMERLGFDSPQQVSNTLVTGKRMFARMLRVVVGEYAQGDEEVEAELRDLWSILSRGGGGAPAPPAGDERA